MPERRNAKLLQVFRRQARKNRLINLILAERSLILSKAKAPQPNYDVHDGALTLVTGRASRAHSVSKSYHRNEGLSGDLEIRAAEKRFEIRLALCLLPRFHTGNDSLT